MHQFLVGSLLIFVGGEQIAASRCEPDLKALGRRIWYFEETATAGHLNLILESAISAAVPLPVLAAIRNLFEEARACGLWKVDYSAVIKVLEDASKIEVRV